MKEWQISSIDDLPSISKEILEWVPKGSCIYFYGDLGAGKTTLIKNLLLQLDHEGSTSSPTYSIVNVYDVGGASLYHIDLYRLKSLDEALDLDIEYYLEPELYTLIEWPQIIEDLTPDQTYTIHITVNNDGQRRIKLDSYHE